MENRFPQGVIATILVSVFFLCGEARATDALRVRIGGIESRLEHRRTDPEFFALRLGGGNYGAYGMVSFATLRWERFYFDTARFFLGGGRMFDHGDRGMIAGMGIAMGFPWHIDIQGKHEIRFGLGLGAGMIQQFSYCEPSEDSLFGGRSCVHAQQAFGFLLSPEIYYIWHVGARLALQIGVDLHIATYPNTFYEDPPDVTKTDLRNPIPAFNGFVGLRF